MTEEKPRLELLDLHGNYWNGVDEDGNVVPVGRHDIDNYDTGVDIEPVVESEPHDSTTRRLGTEAIRAIVTCWDCGKRLGPGNLCAHLGVSMSGKIYTEGSRGYNRIGIKPRRKNA